jgi:hypothetical protein
MDSMGTSTRTRSRGLAAAAAIVVGTGCVASSALAQHDRRGAPHWHGDIAHFHEHDWGLWRGGRWVHERHDGHLGWWWVVAGTWYRYPAPIYPYPSPWAPPPAEIVVPQAPEMAPPPTSFWYFCEASKTYYPYVASCPGGWRQVPAVPAEAAASQAR